MEKSNLFFQSYKNLENEVLNLTDYVFITDEITMCTKNGLVLQPCNSQLETFSPKIADLLVRCCVEIEAISKELYFEIGGTKTRGDKELYFDEDCLKLINDKWDISNKTVSIIASSFNLTKEENKIIKPLRNAHKRSGNFWAKAYQAVKHDRYLSIYKGTIKAVIYALAALYLLNLYYKYYQKDVYITKYSSISSLDYSFGSRLFAVNPPKVEQLWYGNSPVSSDSPFIATYKETAYKKIEEIQNKEANDVYEFMISQPEFEEDDFKALLKERYEQAKQNNDRVIPLWELTKYRLNKKIPDSLSFEQRKDLLLNSKEWNGWIHQHNPHLAPEELTSENIQKEIDSIGTQWGMELMKQFQKLDWIDIAMNQNVCKITIPA